MKKRCLAAVVVAVLGVAGLHESALAQGYYLGQTAKEYDFRRFLGRWRRSDNGAVFQITNVIVRNGKTELIYFAGSVSAKIDSARITQSGAAMRLTVPLAEAGLFGHVYDLRYDTATDTFRGVYRQPPAADKNVVFTR